MTPPLEKNEVDTQSSGSSSSSTNAEAPPQPPPVAQQHISRVAVRAPPFWKENPALWFRQLESQFFMNGIVSSETKFHIAVAALDTEIINQVSDVVMHPPAANLMYESLKSRLQERFAESEERRFKKLLNKIELGDRKPSHLWREMRELAGAGIGDDFLRSLWLQRLPAQIQAILSTDDGDVTRLLTMADRIHEVIDIRGDIQSIQTNAHNNVASTSSASSLDFQQLCMQVNELSRQLAEMSSVSRNSSRSRSSGRGGRTRFRSRSRQPEDMCWYHFKFGKDAKKCIKPCTYKTEN